MANIVFVADAHIGTYREFDVNGSRLNRCIRALEQVFCYASNERALVIDAGDLIDRKNLIDVVVYNELVRTLTEWEFIDDLTMWSLVGNHNLAYRDGSENNLTPLSSYLDPIDKPTGMVYDNCSFWFIPYLPDWKTQWQEAVLLGRKFLNNNRQKHNFLIAHQEIKGAKAGTHRYIAKDGIGIDDIAATWDWCLFGHYHAHQKLRPNVWYLGALLQQDFGEEGNPQGFWSFDTVTGEWTYVPVTAATFRTVNHPDEVIKGHYHRLIVPDDLEVDLFDIEDVRLEYERTAVEEERLVGAGRSVQSLVNAYIDQRVDTSLREPVKGIIQTLQEHVKS